MSAQQLALDQIRQAEAARTQRLALVEKEAAALLAAARIEAAEIAAVILERSMQEVAREREEKWAAAQRRVAEINASAAERAATIETISAMERETAVQTALRWVLEGYTS